MAAVIGLNVVIYNAISVAATADANTITAATITAHASSVVTVVYYCTNFFFLFLILLSNNDIKINKYKFNLDNIKLIYFDSTTPFSTSILKPGFHLAFVQVQPLGK